MWSKEQIAGCETEVFLPARPARFLMLFLTDWDSQTPSESGLLDPHLEEFQFAVAVLKSADCWWVNRLSPTFSSDVTPESWLLNSWLPAWRDRFSTQPMCIMGFGSGGQGAFRLALLHPRQFQAVASLEGYLDFYELLGKGTSLDEIYESREQARQDSPILALRGYNVPNHIWFSCSPDSFWLRGNERMREKLTALGLPHVADFATKVCGYSWSYYETMAPRAVRYLAEGLAQESMKLV